MTTLSINIHWVPQGSPGNTIPHSPPPPDHPRPSSYLCLYSLHFPIPLSSPRWVERQWNRRVEYWGIRSFVHLFARTAHSFACPLAHSLTLELMGKWYMSITWTRRFHAVSTHCVMEIPLSRMTSLPSYLFFHWKLPRLSSILTIFIASLFYFSYILSSLLPSSLYSFFSSSFLSFYLPSFLSFFPSFCKYASPGFE